MTTKRTYNTRKNLEKKLDNSYDEFFAYLKKDVQTPTKVNDFIQQYNATLAKLDGKVPREEMMRYRRKFFKLE